MLSSVVEPLRLAVKEAFGIDKTTPVQDEAWKMFADEGKARSDLVIRARTGSGKTLGFLVPILNTLLKEQEGQARLSRDALGTTCIIIVPTRELAVQTGQVLEKLLAKLKGQYHWIVSGVLSGGEKRKSEKARLRKTLHIVVATPGRLLDLLSSTQGWTEKVRKSLRWLVVDEADRLMDMGFEKKMKEIGEKLGIIGFRSAKVILCSATLKDDTKAFAGIELRTPFFASPVPERRVKSTEVQAEYNAPAHLQQKFVAAPTKLRLLALIGLLKSVLTAKTAGKVVLFTLCCDSVDFYYKLFTSPLLKEFLPAELSAVYRLHGSLEQKERISSFQGFVNSTSGTLLICTDIAARGLNLERVTTIIQYDAPCDINDYLHRAGRTARQEEAGQSYLFLLPSEKPYVELLRGRGMTIGSASWDSLLAWVKATNIKTAKSIKSVEPAEDVEADADALDANLRLKASNWQSHFEAKLKEDEALFNLAKKAYLASIRAYATHASAEKHIFHIKKLHLGHVASTFGLAQPPTSFSSKGADKGNTKKSAKLPQKPGQKERTGSQNGKKGGPSNAKGRPNLKRPAPVSEFGAGDIYALFPSSKKIKKGRV